MLRLNTVTSLVKKRKRIGRGGERGGTSGRGHKGQKARTAGRKKLTAGFEGGQTPLYRRLPKVGFTQEAFEKKQICIVNLAVLERAFGEGEQVDKAVLRAKGLINVKKSMPEGVVILKILGTGSLKKKLNVIADAFSVSARSAIEKVGGQARLAKEM